MDDVSGVGNPAEGNPSEGSPGGSPGLGGDLGSQEDLQSRLDAAEKGKRHFQGLADQREVALKRMEAQLSDVDALKAQVEQLTSLVGSLKMPSVDDIARTVAGSLTERQKYSEYKAELGKRYPGVDVERLGGKTVDELEAEAKEEHARLETIRKAAFEEAREAFRKQLGQDISLGDANGDPADQAGGSVPGQGAMTPEDFLKLSPDAQDKVDDETFDKLMAALSEKGDARWVERSTGDER